MNYNMETLTKYWGAEVANQIMDVATVEGKKMTCDEFLSHCTTCEGDWGKMLLTGIKELFPAVWEIIPDNMGTQAFICICCVVSLCGISDEPQEDSELRSWDEPLPSMFDLNP